MMRLLTPAERLIVAADFKPNGALGRAWVRAQVLALAVALKNTGVCLKVNSALRACGYDLIDEIHACGLAVFADLKFYDIPSTLETDGRLLQETKPELVTVACATGIASMQALKAELPATEVLGVTVLTSQTDADTRAMFVCLTDEAARRFARAAADAKLDGLISSPRELATLKANFGMLLSLNTPAIRPAWATIIGDDQNPLRVMTPADAIRAGADRIVVGRPIIRASNPYDAVMCTIDEIASALG